MMDWDGHMAEKNYQVKILLSEVEADFNILSFT